jgi:hypothetical protein
MTQKDQPESIMLTNTVYHRDRCGCPEECDSGGIDHDSRGCIDDDGCEASWQPV